MGISVSVHSCGGQWVYQSVFIHVEDRIHVEVRIDFEIRGYIIMSVVIHVEVRGYMESVLIHVEVKGYMSQC